jgi:uncharacterized protein YlxP (DUF503 family)
MFVGIARLGVVIGESHSLKETRMVVRRIKDRVRDRVGVIVNEVGDQDVWQRAELGCAVVSADRANALDLLERGARGDGRGFDGGEAAMGQDDWVPHEWQEELRP